MTNPQTLDGYFSIVLTKDSQNILLTKYSPLYQKVFAHHVTLVFKPTVEVYEKYKMDIGKTILLNVYGYAKDEHCETVVVDIEGLTSGKPEDKIYHITLSTDGVAPVYSNTLLQKGFTKLDEPFVLHGVLEFVEHKARF